MLRPESVSRELLCCLVPWERSYRERGSAKEPVGELLSTGQLPWQSAAPVRLPGRHIVSTAWLACSHREDGQHACQMHPVHPLSLHTISS